MKKSGFTLIELLTVLVILAIIALVITPIVGDLIQDSKTKLSKEQKNIIIRSAQKWALANNNALSVTDGAVYNLSLRDLKNPAYYDNVTVKDPANTTKDMDGCIKITYHSSSQDYTYEYVESRCTTGPAS